MEAFANAAKTIEEAEKKGCSYCFHIHGGPNVPKCGPPQRVSCLGDEVKTDPGAQGTGGALHERTRESSVQDNQHRPVQGDRHDHADHRATISTLTEENAAQARRIAELEARFRDLSQENDQKTRALKQLQAEFDQAAEQQLHEHTANEGLGALNIELQSENARLQAENDQLQTANAELTNANRDLTNQAAGWEQTIEEQRRTWAEKLKKADKTSAKYQDQRDAIRDRHDQFLRAMKDLITAEETRSREHSVDSSRSRSGSSASIHRDQGQTLGPSSDPELNRYLHSGGSRPGSVKRKSPTAINGAQYATKRPFQQSAVGEE